jgi:hypothetical protein
MATAIVVVHLRLRAIIAAARFAFVGSLTDSPNQRAISDAETIGIVQRCRALPSSFEEAPDDN